MSFLTELENNFWTDEAEVKLDTVLATGCGFVPLSVFLTDKWGGHPPPNYLVKCQSSLWVVRRNDG